MLRIVCSDRKVFYQKSLKNSGIRVGDALWRSDCILGAVKSTRSILYERHKSSISVGIVNKIWI